jgi:hypothetical protein
VVDYSFLKQSNGKKRGRVEFFDVDLPPGRVEITGKQLTTTDRVRQQIKAGEAGLKSMQKEVDELVVETKEDFYRSVEMIGQIKNLKKWLIDAVNEIIMPQYQEYKAGRNILTAFTPKLDRQKAQIEAKQEPYSYKAEMARREAERRAAEEAAKLQAKIDAEKKKMDEAEKKKAKKEKREPVFHEPIVVDTPVVPKEVKTTTESGIANIKMVLVPTITEPKNEYVIDKILYYFEDKFMELALKAANKAIKAGAIGLKGAPGISVEERAVTKHRRR